MRFESRQAFFGAQPLSRSIRRTEAVDDLPPEIAFLRTFHVEQPALRAAARAARRDGSCAAQALISEGGTSASLYYRALARYLDVPFVDTWPLIIAPRTPAAGYKAEAVRLAPGPSARWLVAPTDERLQTLIAARGLGLPLGHLAITTPSHFAAIVQYRAQDAVEHAASDGLHRAAPELSAKRAAGATAYLFAGLVLACAFTSLILPRLLCDVVGLMFLAGIWFRVAVCAAGLRPAAQLCRAMRNEELPAYTVLVPLHREEAIVPRLVANLLALDYPLSKLEVLILVEPEDVVTRRALAAMKLPPHFRIVIGPSHTHLRTKPRALNIGLMMARGSLLTVYDAEDCPDPDQLRRAADLFSEGPETLACVQALLAMGNGDDGLLAKLFAIEYAALFDIYNVGTTALGMPLALGGTSNHFRVSALRSAGGWDAWNVTEDAELGLRLARMGYDVATLDSTTVEAAPTSIPVWMKQRRRWTKGWKRSVALLLMLINLVAGPLMLPVFSGIIAYHLVTAGFPRPIGALGCLESSLDFCVLLSGIASTLWSSRMGIRVRGLDRFSLCLPLVLPYQLMISVAAWMGLWDLVTSPFHWHKTPH